MYLSPKLNIILYLFLFTAGQCYSARLPKVELLENEPLELVTEMEELKHLVRMKKMVDNQLEFEASNSEKKNKSGLEEIEDQVKNTSSSPKSTGLFSSMSNFFGSSSNSTSDQVNVKESDKSSESTSSKDQSTQNIPVDKVYDNKVAEPNKDITDFDDKLSEAERENKRRESELKAKSENKSDDATNRSEGASSADSSNNDTMPNDKTDKQSEDKKSYDEEKPEGRSQHHSTDKQSSTTESMDDIVNDLMTDSSTGKDTRDNKNNVPTIHYSHNMRILKLPRTTPVGSLIYRLKASAAQEKPLKFMVANGTDVNLIKIKSVDFYQANVYLNQPLQENEYNFTIYVTDGVDRTLVDCQIVVKNGSQLMTSSFIHFRPLLSVPEGSDYFGIRYIFGPKGTSKAEIYLKTQLDFETKNLFRLQVYALNAWTNETFDTRNIVMKELIVTVINEQDTPPVFKQIPHLVQLTEANSEGDIILTLDAVDGDQEQDRKIKYYLRQEDELHNHFLVDANSGEVVLKSSIDSLRELVGHENLFTLSFVAKEVDDENGDTTRTLTGRKIDNHNYEFDHLAGGLSADLDLPNEADSHNHYIVNDNFYDDEATGHVNHHPPISSSLTSDLLAVDSNNRLADRVINSKVDTNRNLNIDTVRNSDANSNIRFDTVRDMKFDTIRNTNNDANSSNKSNTNIDSLSRRTDRAETLSNLQTINHMVLNRIPLKSTPINMPPLMPSQFRKRMLPNPLSEEPHHQEVSSLLKPPINLTNELNRLENTKTTTTSTSRPSTTTNTAKPFYVTSKPMTIKPTTFRPMTTQSTTSTTKSTTAQSTTIKPIKNTYPKTSSSTIQSPIQTTATTTQTSQKQSTTTQATKASPPTIASVTSKPLPLLIKNQRNQAKDVNLANDNLVADEHYIVNNLTSIGLMDENFKPESLIEPETSAESNRLNNERASAMNAVLSELSGQSRTETEISVGFIILQISNHAPEFPFVRPNFTNNNDLLFIVYGQIEENSRANTLVQLEQELIITDQDHGLNGTFDVQINDPTNTFDIQPKTGYRNQTFQIQLVNSNQLRTMENKQINLKIIVTDRSPFKSLKSELIVAVKVLNTNDNFPQFTKDLFRATINEREEIGTKITTISATDSDSGDYGAITYSHLLGDLSGNLALNQVTGEITLVSLMNIDREKQNLYTLIIYVCDNYCKPEESNSNQTLLLIEIGDFNDNKPEFSVSRYDYLLNSDLFTFSSPIQVNATDADEPNTPNSNVTYEIISGNLQNKFKLNALTGEIELISPLLLEGSETLPIIDLENDQPPSNNIDEEDSKFEKTRIIDYPWKEDNYELAHLDNLFSYFSPVINLTIRAHDQGIPIMENFINVYIHCQNYINRTVVFLVNDKEDTVKRKKAEYERYLSEMASGRVRIKTIQEPPAATNLPNRTLVYSAITYPSQSVVNVDKVNFYSAKILGAPPNLLNVPGGWSWLNWTGINRQGRNQLDTNTHSVKTAGLDNNSFITWLLIMIILISLIFLLILIAIWCYFCGCRKRKNKINSADSNNYYSHHLKTQQMNRQLLKNQHLENDSIDSGQDKTEIKLLATASPRVNYPMSEFDTTTFNGPRYKKRVKPSSAVFDNTGYVSDADPSGNFILARKPRSALDNGQRAYVDDTGVFTSNQVNYDERAIDVGNIQQSPLDIYNEDAYSILNRVWFGERGEKRQHPTGANQQTTTQPTDHQQHKEETMSDPYATVRRNKVKFTDEGDSSSSETETTNGRLLSQDETSVKLLQDKHRTASQLTLRSQVNQIESSDVKEKQEDQEDSISKLPKAILRNTDQARRSSANVSPSSDADLGIGHKDGKSKRKESLKDKESSARRDSNHLQPPTPPPLPSSALTSQAVQQQLHHVAQKLHLKNEDVAAKKSVFTIAYNGVKTDRLNSADSSQIYI